MLCPRGAAWLVTRDDRIDELTPLAPNWNSTEPPHGYFGGPMHLATAASRCDASPAWFSWTGARAALRLLRTLDPVRVERHCLDLASLLLERARELGLQRATHGPTNEIAATSGHSTGGTRASGSSRTAHIQLAPMAANLGDTRRPSRGAASAPASPPTP